MMTFKEFIHLDELHGQYGSVQALQSPMGTHLAMKRMHTPVKRGTSVGRAFSAGHVRSPARPAKLTTSGGPSMVGSVL